MMPSLSGQPARLNSGRHRDTERKTLSAICGVVQARPASKEHDLQFFGEIMPHSTLSYPYVSVGAAKESPAGMPTAGERLEPLEAEVREIAIDARADSDY